jgi:hypothetical protein
MLSGCSVGSSAEGRESSCANPKGTRLQINPISHLRSYCFKPFKKTNTHTNKS